MEIKDVFKWLVGVAISAFVAGFGAVLYLNNKIDNRVADAAKPGNILGKRYEAIESSIEANASRMEENVDAIQDIANQNTLTKLDVDSLISTAIEPLKPFADAKGIVAAFNRTEHEGTCPTGWEKFIHAGGRTIIGAGQHSNVDEKGISLPVLPSYLDNNITSIGGKHNYTLNLSNLPPHQHATTPPVVVDHDKYPWQSPWEIARISPTIYGYKEAVGFFPQYQVGRSSYPLSSSVGGSDGKAEPITIKTPYVALFYCIKLDF